MVSNSMFSENIRSASISSSIINLSNTIIGSGMLALPSAIAAVGLGLGMGMLLLAGLATAFQLYLLSYSGVNTPEQPASYRSVALATIPKGAIFFDLAVGIKCFGVSISYLIIMGDLLPTIVATVAGNALGVKDASAIPPTSTWSLPAMNALILLDRRFWITFVMVPLVPLCFLKRLDALKYTSVIALFAAAYLLWIVVYYSFDGSYTLASPGTIDMARMSPKFFKSFSIFVFAYTCHQNIFAIHNELADYSMGNMKRIIFASVGVAMILYQLVGDLGYLIFGRTVKPNIIQMFNEGTFVTVGRFAIVLLVLFSYPLMIHPTRDCLERVFNSNPSSEEKTETSPPKSSSKRFVMITSSVLLCSYACAILVRGLDTVLAFVGATGSTLIGYILPGFFYYKVKKLQYDKAQSEAGELSSPQRLWTITLLGAVTMIVMGFVIMFICLGVIFLGW